MHRCAISLFLDSRTGTAQVMNRNGVQSMPRCTVSLESSGISNYIDALLFCSVCTNAWECPCRCPASMAKQTHFPATSSFPHVRGSAYSPQALRPHTFCFRRPRRALVHALCPKGIPDTRVSQRELIHHRCERSPKRRRVAVPTFVRNFQASVHPERACTTVVQNESKPQRCQQWRR